MTQETAKTKTPHPLDAGPDALGPDAAEIGKAAGQKPKKPGERDFVSKGEKITGFFTYAIVDWVFNAASGVAFAYWGKHTKFGKEHWSIPITDFYRKVLHRFFDVTTEKGRAHLEHSAGRGTMFTGIITGGLFTLPPLLVLEHNPVKLAITKFLDRHIYGEETVENDPKFQQAYDEILQAPKKDFWTGFITRYIALAPLLTLVLARQTKDVVNEKYFYHISNTTEDVTRKIGFQPKGLMEQLRGDDGALLFDERGRPFSKWTYLHETLAMDAGLGPIYAVLHSKLYHHFADKKRAPEHETPLISGADAPQVAKTEQGDPASVVDNSRQAKDETLSDVQKHLARKTDSAVERAQRDREVAASQPQLAGAR